MRALTLRESKVRKFSQFVPSLGRSPVIVGIIDFECCALQPGVFVTIVGAWGRGCSGSKRKHFRKTNSKISLFYYFTVHLHPHFLDSVCNLVDIFCITIDHPTESQWIHREILPNYGPPIFLCKSPLLLLVSNSQLFLTTATLC